MLAAPHSASYPAMAVTPHPTSHLHLHRHHHRRPPSPPPSPTKIISEPQIHLQQQSPLFRLPAELRNQIYTYLFSPPPQPPRTLTPSPSALTALRALATCRLLALEAATLAAALLLGRCTRWHREDLTELADVLKALPGPLLTSKPQPRWERRDSGIGGLEDEEWEVEDGRALLTTFHLVAHERVPHVSPGPLAPRLAFLDAGADFAAFVFDVLSLFPAVRCVKVVLGGWHVSVARAVYMRMVGECERGGFQFEEGDRHGEVRRGGWAVGGFDVVRVVGGKGGKVCGRDEEGVVAVVRLRGRGGRRVRVEWWDVGWEGGRLEEVEGDDERGEWEG
ncbi:hypothetical protein EJ06DRAFT_580888 [Trichodelitschia bisporula]|uniref:Uncharacterized protein n=1 Tax=Trichodelitschia bisporula TaxID=703511 RepID=A0A6G1I088_9PEZI|nr:hypothetical protein EJ06DRAFT_580888 [Trichodelitschia bisporula]